MKILVLAGGESHEREVSLATAEAVAEALRSLGHEVKMIDTVDGADLLTADIKGRVTDRGRRDEKRALSPVRESGKVAAFVPSDMRDSDCVFIALHGGTGENGTLQALLDLADIPYTGSGVLASALAMDKHRAKLVFGSVGIPTPRTIFFGNQDSALRFIRGDERYDLEYPVIVKPNAEGSTVGLTLAKDYGELLDGIRIAAEYGDSVMIEEYIPGRELTVAILGDEALPVVEIIPKSGLYDYRAKYTSGESEYVCPAVVNSKVETDIKQFAQLAYQVLGCSGYARVDFRLNPDNELFCLEVNTLPGMTSTSLVPKAAKAAGISFAQLLERIISLSLDRRRDRVAGE